MMRSLLVLLLLMSFVSCHETSVNQEGESDSAQNFLHGFPALADDNLVNVVIEISAGTNQKWEVDKTDGSLKWQQITTDSMRMVAYLPYPANYGMIPRTLLPADLGGDGDPLDVFLLGPSLERGTVMPATIIGLIRMRDTDEQDDKLIAVSRGHWFGHIASLQQLEDEFPGVLEILFTWLANYKGKDVVQLLSVEDEHYANKVLQEAIEAFNQSNKDR